MSRQRLHRSVRGVVVLVPMLFLVPGLALAAQNPGDAQQAKQAFSAFFNPQTSTSKRVNLLENGKQYKDTLQQQVKQPIAKSTSANVSNVQIQGNQAQVTYSIVVSGTPMLKNQHGTMVKQDGKWKVSEGTFCQIESMQGSPPSGCPGH